MNKYYNNFYNELLNITLEECYILTKGNLYITIEQNKLIFAMDCYDYIDLIAKFDLNTIKDT